MNYFSCFYICNFEITCIDLCVKTMYAYIFIFTLASRCAKKCKDNISTKTAHQRIVYGIQNRPLKELQFLSTYQYLYRIFINVNNSRNCLFYKYFFVNEHTSKTNKSRYVTMKLTYHNTFSMLKLIFFLFKIIIILSLMSLTCFNQYNH